MAGPAHRPRRAVATRLRTLLDPETGISPALARALVALLDADLHPAVPATGNGAAGEIIPLAHLGGFLTGIGEGVAAGGTAAAADVLLRGPASRRTRSGRRRASRSCRACRSPPPGRCCSPHDARLLAAQALAVAAGELALVRAPRDPYAAALARGDADAGRACTAVLRALAGDEDGPADAAGAGVVPGHRSRGRAPAAQRRAPRRRRRAGRWRR